MKIQSRLNEPQKSVYNFMKEEKRQKLLIFMCWLIYVVSYVSRYSYNANIVAIKDYYGVTNSVTGLVGTCFFFAYGIGQVVNGFLCKKYNKKFFLSFPLMISAAINFYLFTCPSVYVYKYLWLLNGVSLSVLWSLLVLTLSENLDDKHLTGAMIVMSSTVAAGTVIAYGASALFNLFGDFKYSFLTGGVAASAVAVIWLFTCDKLTVKDGLKISAESGSAEYGKGKKDTFVIATLAIFGLFMIIGNLVKDGLNVWVPQILKDTYGFGDSLSIILTLALPLLGLFGAMFVVALNKIIKNGVLLNSLLFAVSAVCVFGVMLLLKTNCYVLVIVLFGLLSLLMHAANNFITSFVPLKLRENFNSGLLAGILNGCGYVGSTISSYGLGVIADKSGWNGVFVLLTILCGVVVGVSFIFAVFGRKKSRSKNSIV